MEPMCRCSEKVLLPLSDGFALMPFDAEVFLCHPFGHGQNYPDYDGFSKRGSGFVIRYGNDVVSSASSFLTFENEIELDVSTLEPYRRRGLADHCVAALLNDCAERGILVHWDAQNAASAELALSHGFRKEAEYTVTILKHSVV